MILAILVGSHLGKIPMKFESHWPKGSVGVSFFQTNYSRFSIFSSGDHFAHRSENRFSQFGRGSPKQHSYEVKMKSAQGYRRS